MIGLDTNVLVRYLAGDPETEVQVIQAVAAIDNAFQHGITIFINNVVICETVWVLLYHYHTPKKQLIEALNLIIKHPLFQFEGRGSLNQALKLYEENRSDFADCLIAVLNREHGCKQTLSFDKQAIKELEFKHP